MKSAKIGSIRLYHEIGSKTGKKSYIMGLWGVYVFKKEVKVLDLDM
jgi:hypothetical protein